MIRPPDTAAPDTEAAPFTESVPSSLNSYGQISRRIKAATKMAGLGDGFSAHSPRVGMAQDFSPQGRNCPI